MPSFYASARSAQAARLWIIAMDGDKRRSVANHRIKQIKLDERTIMWRNADVEQERRIAIFDLLEDNSFAPQRAYPDDYAGPYLLNLAVEEGRLVLAIAR